jgi:hypothetical protein
MVKTYQRRQMLKWLSGTAAAAITAGLRTARDGAQAHRRAPEPDAPPVPITPEPKGENAWELHGRAIHTVAVYKEASTGSERTATYYRDESFPILGEERAPFTTHNDRWYRLKEGYVHSAWVLPIRVYPLQPFIETIGSWGFWGEIARIYTDARTAPSLNAGRPYRFYGSTVFHVVDAQRDDEGNGWYKVVDDYPPRQNSNFQWIQAEHVRRIPRAEMAPIHPFVSDKRIEVSISEQVLTCYEGETAVFETLVASGLGGELATPLGDHCVLLKQASRHMSNVPYADMKEEDQPAPGDIFDLPGVPWNIFFDLNGTAIHGAYWHNDFGIRRSHGCLNVPVDAARWIYRWVHPVGGYEDDFIQSTCSVGTLISILA